MQGIFLCGVSYGKCVISILSLWYTKHKNMVIIILINERNGGIKMIIATDILPKLSNSVLQYLAESNYSIDTQRDYRGTYNQLLLYLMENKLQTFDIEVGKAFIRDHYGSERLTFSKCYYVNLLRRLKTLIELHETGRISTKRYITKNRELSTFQQIYNFYHGIQQNRGLSLKTIEYKCSKIKDFLLFLEKRGFKSFSKVVTKDVYAFLNLKQNYAISTKENTLYVLRDAFKIFTENGLCDNSLKELFPQISTHSESPIPSSFTTQELRMILSSVDRTTPIGKRDYAVLLLASFLGIRTGDIRYMRLDYIKWSSGMIEFTQSKTKRFLQLPIPIEVKLALLDYLKNGRPFSGSEYLIIKSMAPYGPLGSHNSLGYILQKYLGGIKLNGRKHGMHSLRFSAAGNMLSNGTSITTICNVLGHCYSDTTNHYLKIDLKQLKKAALEVPVL
jgi:integrase/recombinase XerD